MINMLLAATITGVSWAGIVVQTGKTSEYMVQEYFRTESDCRTANMPGEAEDRVCIPIPLLPESFFLEQEKEARAQRKEQCFVDADASWTDSGKEEATAECTKLFGVRE